MTSVLVLSLVSLIFLSAGADAADTCGKTPRTIMVDFIESCANLQVPGEECMKAVELFVGAFYGKNPVAVSPCDYDPYFDYLPIEAGPSENLFWSGTFPLVDQLSSGEMGVTVVSSANSLPSHILNDISPSLVWCGNRQGIDYENDCLCSVTDNFWYEFSALFARVAQENAFYLCYGEREGGAFSRQSYFSTVEIPNMKTGFVKTVVALNVHEKGKGEACGEGSLADLEVQVVDENMFAYECYDIYGVLDDTVPTSICVANVIKAVQMGQTISHEVECSNLNEIVRERAATRNRNLPKRIIDIVRSNAEKKKKN